MKDWATRILRRMLLGMHRGMAAAMQEGLKELMDDLMKGAVDPSRIADFARAMGIDLSRLSGMMSHSKVADFDPYQILGLDKSASDEDIKKRYHELVKKLHPDTAGVEGTGFLLQLVLAAYELIKRERGWQ